jgi:hypothetical protein
MQLGIVRIVALTTLSLAVHAQEKPRSTYRLNFRLEETAAEAARTTRSYALVVQSRSRGKINASRRLPYYTSSKGETKELHTAALGSIIECIADDKDAGVVLDCAIESSYVALDQPSKPAAGFLPVVNSRQVSTTALLAIGTEVQIVRLDDPSSKNRLEIFVSVERLTPPVGSIQ